MIYEYPFTIYTLLSDRYARLTVPATAQLLQEVAEIHSTATGIGYHKMIQDNKIWVLTRVSYRFLNRYPKLDEQVKLRTWSKGCNGLTATREFEILSSMNEVLVAATSQWVIIDLSSRRVERISGDFLANYEHHNQSALSFESPRLRLPEGMQEVKNFPIEFSMVDKAQHVNNAEYIRWFVNCLTPEEQKAGVLELDINYNMETRPQEIAHIWHKKQDNVNWFQVTNDRGPSVIARIVVS